MRKRELEVLGQKLSGVWSLDVLGLLDLDDLEDVNGAPSGSVTSSHVLVKGLDGADTGEITVFSVHVVDTGTRVVTDPDTEVLDLGRSLLVDLVDGDNLTSGLLDSSQLGEEVPETGLSNNRVWCEDSHTVELWLWLLLSWQVTANDLILVETTH